MWIIRCDERDIQLCGKILQRVANLKLIFQPVILQLQKKIADTDVLIYSNEENIEYYDEIFRIILHGGTINEMNDIELFCCSHDYDWLVVCLFKDKMLFYNFLDYLSKKNICIRVSSVEEWQ